MQSKKLNLEELLGEELVLDLGGCAKNGDRGKDGKDGKDGSDCTDTDIDEMDSVLSL